jgi:hypothetical protein
MVALAVAVLSNLRTKKMPELPLVRYYFPFGQNFCPTVFTNKRLYLDKFTGYQYGGRPLGLTYVKYLKPNAGGGAMEGITGTEGLTQDQIM